MACRSAGGRRKQQRASDYPHDAVSVESHGKREREVAGELPHEFGAMRVCLTRVAWGA